MTLAKKPDRIVHSSLSHLIDNGSAELFAILLCKLKGFEQRKYLNGAITFVVRRYFASHVANNDEKPFPTSKTVSAAASLLYLIAKDNDVVKEYLVSLLTRSTIPLLDDSLVARRGVIAALSKDEGQSISVFALASAHPP